MDECYSKEDVTNLKSNMLNSAALSVDEKKKTKREEAEYDML